MELLEQIIQAARQAGDIMLAAQNISAQQQEKSGDYNLVTVFDVKVQNFLFSTLGRILPEAKFIGEEEGTDTPTPLEHGYSFIIDPIDGTTNFIQGYRHSCTSVALLKDGKPYIGVVYNPYNGELFSAQLGKGAWLNGVRISAAKGKLEENLVAFGTSPYYRHISHYFDGTFDTLKKLYPHCQDLRRSGSAALDLCYVACGRTALFFELILSPYDYAAASLIVHEAGGLATQMSGEPLNYGQGVSVLAAGKTAYAEYFDIMTKA